MGSAAAARQCSALPVEEIDCRDARGQVSAAITAGSEPVVLRNLVSHWKLVACGAEGKQAFADYLLSAYNDRSVMTYSAPAQERGRYFYRDDFQSFNFTKRGDTLAGFFSRLHAATSSPEADSIFIPSMHLPSFVPAVMSENVLQIDGVENPLVQAWLGSPSLIACHFDAMHNIACCVAGKRRFTLFPPDQAENLYIGPLDNTPAGQPVSVVDIDNPDFERFPRFAVAQAHKRVIELKPGDALFLPSMWWHQVEGLAPFNGMVNYWWRSAPAYCGEPMDALTHAMLSIRQLPEAERAAWRSLFEHYVFTSQDGRYDHIPEPALGRLGPFSEREARRLRAILQNQLSA
ncbi:cupin-like domain-containing protein [Microbulbifer sp. YPW1]|uniref:cupin-like domain-containing protein n=1 Tax=Microbulbifer sp. YPW1 TaxID=2745199 RepID=UPI002101D88C|nr:cupin-like domain-containing protein [Microbulbifer sp. YPW1]